MIDILVLVLGPVEAQTDHGEPIPLGPPKQRALLAALMLRAGQGVTAAELVDVLWPTDPPRSAVKNLQLYVHQLRKLLGVALPYRGGAYRLDTEGHRLDAVEFEKLLAEARRTAAAGDLDRARHTYDQALAWWRGPALADLVDRGLLVGEATALQQAHLAALDESVELAVRLSSPAAVLPRLHRLVADHPLHERFREHQVRGLLAAGRPAEASAAYQEARRLLASELGVAPGSGLRTVGDAIDRATAPPAPAQLPADIADFTGRDRQVAAITADLTGEATAMRICAISGTAGVGKSTLAVHLAHRLRAHYPDGQLHVALHGQGTHRTDPADVLAPFLRALGQSTPRLPVDLPERVRLYGDRHRVLDPHHRPVPVRQGLQVGQPDPLRRLGRREPVGRHLLPRPDQPQRGGRQRERRLRGRARLPQAAQRRRPVAGRTREGGGGLAERVTRRPWRDGGRASRGASPRTGG